MVKIEDGVCKAIGDAIEDEEKGAEFYRELGERVLVKMVQENDESAIEAWNVIDIIRWDEKRHRDKLMNIKKRVCG